MSVRCPPGRLASFSPYHRKNCVSSSRNCGARPTLRVCLDERARVQSVAGRR
ncbi:hypothetical protein EKH55_2194 [Sinorhizobium alkalisoli]|nr:hypothetical protein EKH55_2194 [Sinorhizobium alkalisoli]